MTLVYIQLSKTDEYNIKIFSEYRCYVLVKGVCH